MNSEIMRWAIRHGVSHQALAELRQIFGMDEPATPDNGQTGVTEGAVTNQTRLALAREGVRLWRNNSGVAMNDNGQPVRYGLCNESKTMNKVLKSSDLIGIRPVSVTPDMVGARIGQFVARECKPVGWRYTGTDRELAQWKFIELVTMLGGDAKFSSGGML